MIDTVKDYLTPKTFGILAYVCSIIHVLCGLVFTGIAIALEEGEAEKFTCYVPPESTLIYKTQVDKACFTRYQRHYNAPLRFYIFVILSTWFPIIIAVVYSLWVRRRVQQVDKSTINETQADGEANEQVHNRSQFYVFRLYFIHLAIRVLCGVLFTIVQHALLFSRGFDSKFICTLPSKEFRSKIHIKNTSVSQLIGAYTSVACENVSDKQTIWVITSVLNVGFAFTIFLEIIRISKYIISRECDTDFIAVYLLRKKYTRVGLTSVSSNPQQTFVNQNLQRKSASSDIQGSVCPNLQQESVSSNLQQTSDISNLQQDHVSSNLQHEYVSPNLHQKSVSPIVLECIDYYKKFQLLVSEPKAELIDELYISLVIQTERAPHKFLKRMKRHEIYDVYMQVPPNSICLENVEDLFYPNKDTEGAISSQYSGSRSSWNWKDCLN